MKPRAKCCMSPSEPKKTSRRWLLSAAGAGLGVALSPSLDAAGQKPRTETPRILKRGDRVDVGGKGPEIIQNAYDLGHDYEKHHGGCARCTLAALQDAIPFVMVDESLFRGSTCLDGGATPTGTQNCGGFTGAGMIIGYVCGSTRHEEFEGSAALAHELLHRVYRRFKAEYGTVLCKDVRQEAKHDCPNVVGTAAKWVAEILLDEFSDDSGSDSAS
ncbi:MAG: C-GCAxxG-C-C family protein [Planctomycetota bacterium]